MRRITITSILIALLLALLPGGAVLSQDLPPGPTVVGRASFDVTDPPEEFEIIQLILDFAPGAWTPPHVHGGPNLVTVLEGEVTFRPHDGEEQIFGVGEGWLEMPDMIHAAGNDTDDSARVVATFLLPTGAALTTVIDGEDNGELPPGPTVVARHSFDVTDPPEEFEVIDMLLDFAPGAWTPPHVHGGPNLVTVVEGEVTFRPHDGEEQTFRVGEGWLEMPDMVHAAGNDTDDSARVVATFLLPAGAALTTVIEDEPDQVDVACDALPGHAEVTAALQDVVAEDNGGFSLHMWATLVNRDGEVCVVTFSGEHRGDQWPGSRVISAQKANTANAFSLPGLAVATANLFSAVQPGNSLFGLQFSNPVDTNIAYGGDAQNYGQENDPMIGGRIGGVNVFGGGLALYDSDGTLVGGLGVSGDTACADHIVAWKLRDGLGLAHIPGGVSPMGDDNIVFDITVDPATGHASSESGWGHAACGLGEIPIAEGLPSSHPIGE